MKTKQERYYLPAAACLVAALCLLCTAACTDTAGNDPGMDTDAGRTPVILSAGVHGMPATRANTARGEWTDGDVVAVEVDGVVKRYIASSSVGNAATLRPADEANTHYWPAAGQSAKVRAWFYGNTTTYPWDRVPDRWYVSASQNWTDPTDSESEYQQSDFLYAPAQDIAYNAQQGGAALTFYHQTARVVVRLRKAGAVNDGNLENIGVYLGSGPSGSREMWQFATFDDSAIHPAAGQYSGLKANETVPSSYIVMNPIPSTSSGDYACYEALVIPQDMSGKYFIQVHIKSGSGSGVYYYITAPGEADLHGGYTYTYDITVSQHGTLHVTASTPIAGWTDNGEGGSGTAYEETIDPANPPTSINDNRVYLLTGKATGMTLNITGGNPTVIVRDLKLTNSCIHITGGTPEIRVEGTNNTLYSNENPSIWLDGVNANVRIKGGGADKSRLNLYMSRLDQPYAAIGTKGTFRGKADFWCGNIAISGLTLDAYAIANDLVRWGGAVIGTGGGKGNRRCGDITVTDARIIARPGEGAAAIGFGTAPDNTDMAGTTYEMGNITLTNSTIESRIAQGSNGIYPAHIGGGAVPAEHYTVGTISISTDKSAAEFFANFNGGTKALDEVIIGFPGGTKDWLIRWKTDTKFYLKIPWDLVPSLR